ncbi:FUSC family protein [Amycolatopsis sp.]|uniref:FUSC family protein n=1 Tax=Amycolatopsis sp. TaxID=37632 RepID=UPI002C6201BE|nr:FUSC family protein [Amycolatopsis sp.]HVV10661.1 FUSC family protein [Amycolatopsis sp.]
MRTKILAAALGMAGPAAYGVLTGDLVSGTLGALGALAVSGVSQPRMLGLTAVTATAAAYVGSYLAGRGWVMVAGVVVVVAVVSSLTGFSRASIEIATRALTFLVITTGLSFDSVEVVERFAPGAGWAVIVTLVLVAADAPLPKPRIRLWWKSLRRWKSWQYPIRLTGCIALAEVLGQLWQQPKGYWIAVTVAIVVRPRLDGALRRASERALGTAAGVLVGSVTLLWVPSSWWLVLTVGVLAGLRPFLRDRWYALYAMTMTPLVVLLMDFGHVTTWSTIGYRLADTVAGCAIALVAGYLPWCGVGRG